MNSETNKVTRPRFYNSPGFIVHKWQNTNFNSDLWDSDTYVLFTSNRESWKKTEGRFHWFVCHYKGASESKDKQRAAFAFVSYAKNSLYHYYL